MKSKTTQSFSVHNFSYTIRRTKMSKRIKLSVHSDGRCVVSAPRYVPQYLIKQFVISKSEWIMERLDKIERAKAGRPKPPTKAEIETLKKTALALIKARLEYFNTSYGYEWKDIRIKNQKTRWGSCSKRGNLNFNYKIALLPAHMADYIIVHELCHLGEFNHSRNFWKLVEKTIPDYKAIRDALKKEGIQFD